MTIERIKVTDKELDTEASIPGYSPGTDRELSSNNDSHISRKPPRHRKVVAMLSVIGVVLILILAFTTHFLLTGNIFFAADNIPPDVDLFVNNNYIYTLEEVKLTAKYSDDDGSVVKWEWDFEGDGTYDLELLSYKSVYWEYTDDGVYYPSLRVTDDQGDFANGSVEITVRNRLPAASLEISSVKDFTNNDILFDVTATDPDGLIMEYKWDFDGDGNIEYSSPDATAKHSYADDGVYNVELIVVDDDGGETTSTIKITIENRVPEIKIIVSRTAVATNELLSFAADVTDPDGEVILYEWDFNNNGIVDSSSKTTADAEYSFDDDGNYDVVLRVTDDDYAVAESSVVITVSNVEPVAVAYVSSENVSTLTDVIFGCDGSDSDGVIVKYEWDFDGDGEFDWDSVVPVYCLIHSYSDVGLYDAVLRVTDDDGAISLSRKTITVNNRDPTAEILMDDTRETTGIPIKFDGNGTDADGDILLYEWDFNGDGDYDFSSPLGPLTTYTYDDDGIFNAKFKVSDDDGASNVVSVTMTIDENRPPVADAGDDKKSNPGETVILDGSGSSDPDGHALIYLWDFGDGIFGNGTSSSHLYTDAGTYTATLTVTDEGGLEDTDSCVITVVGTKYAVVVGVADYPGQGDDLDYCDDDANHWESYLVGKGYTVHKLLNSEATRENILIEIAWMASAEEPGSYCVFTYSGHGDYEDGSYLLDYTEEGLWDYELANAFSSFESDHIFFFFDCCGSGDFDDDLGGQGRYVVEACGYDESSLEDPDYRYGAFTYWFLVDGLDDHESWSVEDAFQNAYDHCSSDYSWYNFHPEQSDSDPVTPFYLY